MKKEKKNIIKLIEKELILAYFKKVPESLI